MALGSQEKRHFSRAWRRGSFTAGIEKIRERKRRRRSCDLRALRGREIDMENKHGRRGISEKNRDVPRALRLLRKERGYSQKKAAGDLGISQALLSHYERGIRECGLNFLVRAADYYGVSCDYLLGRVPREEASGFAGRGKISEGAGCWQWGEQPLAFQTQDGGSGNAASLADRMNGK